MSKHDISDDDKALFRQAVSGITPINPKNIHQEVKVKPPNPVRRDNSPKKTEPFYLSSYYTTELTGASTIFYCKRSLEKNQLQQFKRGQIKIEATLDLHGYITEEAMSQLIHFIHSQYQKNRRSLLIIHGKGQHGGGAILKNLVNHWLPQFHEVLAVVSAQPKDGGTGAVYVLLKRKVV